MKIGREEGASTFHAKWIGKLESEDHWRLYWNQQRLMEGLVKPGQHILEIGTGSQFAARYMRGKGITVTTVDIDPDKQPDILADARTFVPPAVYDHVMSFETLEHLPFRDVGIIVKRMAAHCRGSFFISVPATERRLVTMDLRLPKFGSRSLTLSAPRLSGRIGAHHFWQLGWHGRGREKVISLFRDSGFELTEYRYALSRCYFAFERRDARA